MKELTKKQRKLLDRILASAGLFVGGLVFSHLVGGTVGTWCSSILFIGAWLLCGYDVFIKAGKNIGHGQVFDENFLMCIATLGAFALRDFSEGAGVMLFFQVGELFQNIAVDRSRKSVAALMDLRPDVAYKIKDGKVEECDPEEVAVGDLLRVLPGERIPVDGVVVFGNSSVDTSKITGESVPADLAPGDRVLSGCISITGEMTIRAESEYASSTVARILELMESANEGKSKTEALITRFARYYTPCVVFGALALSLIVPLFDGMQFTKWIVRGLNFLVISCPCALVISVPLSFFSGMGAVSKAGMIAKGGVALENLAETDTVVFDKTGTLTTGNFQVAEVAPVGMNADELLELAAGAESRSNHPIAKAVVAAAGKSDALVAQLQELPGKGISAQVNGRSVHAGNIRLLKDLGLEAPEISAGTAIYVVVDGAYAGYIRLTDQLKPGAAKAIDRLHTLGIRETVMLTGDREAAAAPAAKEAGISRYYAGLLPQDKVKKVQALLNEGRNVAFVGDGVNDAPVLSLATVGVAMGGIGSDAAVEASDLVLLKDDLSDLPTAIHIARKTVLVSKENIIFALSVKLAVLVLSILGHVSMWLAVFADVGVAVLAILNATRCMYFKK